MNLQFSTRRSLSRDIESCNNGSLYANVSLSTVPDIQRTAICECNDCRNYIAHKRNMLEMVRSVCFVYIYYIEHTPTQFTVCLCVKSNPSVWLQTAPMFPLHVPRDGSVDDNSEIYVGRSRSGPIGRSDKCSAGQLASLAKMPTPSISHIILVQCSAQHIDLIRLSDDFIVFF